MTEPSGGSMAAAPEANQPIATVETTPQPPQIASSPAPQTASAPPPDTPSLLSSDDAARITKTEQPEAPVAPAAPAAQPAQAAPSQSPSVAPVERPSSTPTPAAPTALIIPDATPASATPAPAPAPTPAVPQPASIPTPNVKTEPGNDSFAAATAALGTGLLASLQNAMKRPRTDDDASDNNNNGGGNQRNDTKRPKMEPSPENEPTQAEQLASLIQMALPGAQALPPPAPTPAPPVLAPAPAPIQPAPAVQPIQPAPPVQPVQPAPPAQPFQLLQQLQQIQPTQPAQQAQSAPSALAPAAPAPPPMMDLEAMLKSALGSMNTAASAPPPPPTPAAPISLAPAVSTPAPAPAFTPTPTSTPVSFPAPAAAVTSTASPAPAAPAAPISLTPTPAPSTPSLPLASTAITSPPPQQQLPPVATPSAPIASPTTTWKMPVASTPTKEVASLRREVASPAGASSSGRDHLMGSSSRESKKMRFSQNPTYLSRSMGLPLLGSFAVQLLYALSENFGLGPTDDGPATDSRRIYKLLQSAFRNTRSLFSETAGILSTDKLDIKESGDQETIQMTNMATIASSIFDSDDDISLNDAHDNFLSSFLIDPEALDKELATLFLDLKYYMLAVELARLPDDEKRREFVEKLFPANLQEQLQNLHVDTPITDYEKVFMKDMAAVKEKMLEAAKTDESRQQLSKKYSLDGFRDELRSYLRANEDIVLRYADSHGIEMPGDDDANGDDSEMAADDAESSLLNGTDFTAMGNSIASMLSAAMASSDGLAAAASQQASAQQPSAPAANNGPMPMVIDSGNGANDRPALEASPMAEGVSRLIQEAVQRSAARTSSQPPAAAPQASPASLLATPSVRAHTTAPPPPNGTTAAPPASTESVMDLTGLTKLIKDKLGQDAQEALPPPPPAPVLAPTPAYNMQQQTQSPVAQANAALSSMQNTFANNLAMYNRAPAFPYQQVPAPPPPPPQQQQVNTLNGGNPALPPHQSSPSAILYQQARQAAASKTQGHTRREGLHSTRRPWSPDEEQALMAGLDMVKGPHWSQILQLFGANGSLSDILKDRSQVQLKDKARNLKLFFLKANTEMPYYLKCVTGELKTRAPSQAARKEAEERAKATNKEEQARVQGIMTLAGGLQDNSNKNQAPPAPVAAHAPHAPHAPTHAPVHHAPAPAPTAHHNGMANGNVPVKNVNVAPTNGAPRPVASAAPAAGPPNGMQNSTATHVAAPRAGPPTTTLQNLAPNPAPVSNLPPRITNATQLSAAVQQQLQQLQQRQQQTQQTQQPARQLPGTATTTGSAATGTIAGTTTGTGTGTGAGVGATTGATGVPQRTPITAADVALAAARGGYSATAAALAAQHAKSSAAATAGRPLLATGAMLNRPSIGTTSASIKSVTADLTAGMTAAINNAINNAAIAARPTSTIMTTAQRLAAGRPTSISPSRSPAPTQQQQQRPTQSSPSPIRSLAPQSPAVAQQAAVAAAAARPVQASATTPTRPSPAATPAYAAQSPNVAAQSVRSPATLAGSPAPSVHTTPQPQSRPLTPATVPAAAPAAAPTTAAPIAQATTTATAATAPASALVKPPVTAEALATPASAPATTQPTAQAAPTPAAPAAPQQPEDRLWMLQQDIHTEATKTAPAPVPAAISAAAAPANGIANTGVKPTPTPASVATTTAPSTPAPTATTPVPVATPAPATVPTPSPAPVVKAPPPTPQQQQQQLKQEQQQEDASEESVLARLLASPPN